MGPKKGKAKAKPTGGDTAVVDEKVGFLVVLLPPYNPEAPYIRRQTRTVFSLQVRDQKGSRNRVKWWAILVPVL